MCSGEHKDRKTRVEDAVSGLVRDIASKADRGNARMMVERMIETIPDDFIDPVDLLLAVSDLVFRVSGTLPDGVRSIAPMAVATLAIRAQMDSDERDMRIADAVGRN